jgi:hypothetical protein
MELLKIYNDDPGFLGSPKLCAIFECLARIPQDSRAVKPTIGGISITSDGFIIADQNFLGSVEELETNLYGLCEHFGIDTSEADLLLSNALDWRQGGNAYSDARILSF